MGGSYRQGGSFLQVFFVEKRDREGVLNTVYLFLVLPHTYTYQWVMQGVELFCLAERSWPG